jgi:hypothetical protein
MIEETAPQKARKLYAKGYTISEIRRILNVSSDYRVKQALGLTRKKKEKESG